MTDRFGLLVRHAWCAIAQTLILFAVAGCGEDSTLLAVEGRVTSSEDGAPVAGILVELWHSVGVFEGEQFAAGRTDSEGQYSAMGRTPGECRRPSMQVAWDPFDGYETITTTFDPERFDGELRCTSDVQVINVTVTPRQLTSSSTDRER